MIDLSLVASRLRIDEAVKLKPYVDTAGKVTIGTGRNLTDKGISMEENNFMLDTDIHEALDYAEVYQWFQGLDPARQLVIICMIFNLGPTRFAGFQNMIRDFSNHDFQNAANEMANSAWANQVGKRAQIYEQIVRTGVLPDA
jgi:lysozyme